MTRGYLRGVLAAIAAIFITTQALGFETKAKQAFLIDAATGQVLFAKAADDRMVPSSMSKLMTCYVAFDALKKGELKLDDKMTVSKNAWQMQGSKTFVPVGEQVKVEDLIRGIVVQSGNDATVVVAEGMAGTEDEFASRLNNKAKEIGLTNSNFKNATGWPHDEHYVTARDLAILAQRLINDFPEYYGYFAEANFTFNSINQPNRNLLLTKNVGVDGLKTGHTDSGGYGIVVSAVRDGRRLILVVNGLANDAQRVQEAQNLLNYGFMNFSNVTVAKANTPLVAVNVWMGMEEKVGLISKKDIIVTVPVDQKKSVSATVKYKTPVYAPISDEQELGLLQIQTQDGNQELQLYPENHMDQVSFFVKLIRWLKFFFTNWSLAPTQQDEVLQIVL